MQRIPGFTESFNQQLNTGENFHSQELLISAVITQALVTVASSPLVLSHFFSRNLVCNVKQTTTGQISHCLWFSHVTKGGVITSLSFTLTFRQIYSGTWNKTFFSALSIKHSWFKGYQVDYCLILIWLFFQKKWKFKDCGNLVIILFQRHFKSK